MKRWLEELGPLFGLILVWSLFAALRPGEFATWENQRLMLLQTAVVGIAAVGATFIIVSGGIDLSVGSTIALGTVVIALLLEAGAPVTVAALGGVFVGVAVGFTLGSLVVGRVGSALGLFGAVAVSWVTWEQFGPLGALACGVAVAVAIALLGGRVFPRLPLAPFIVTLGAWGALRGMAKGLGDNQPVYPDELGWLGDVMFVGKSGLTSVLPPGVLLFLATALVAGVVLARTRFGRHVFAIGSNEETARLCGVRVERTKLLVYIVGVGCAGLAAILQFGYLSIGDPTTAEGYELRVIAAVVIGGASLTGGEGSIRGTLVGALIMTVVDNGCTKLGLDNWVQEVATGGIIVTAVALDRLRHRAS
ncbi:MAG: ABC transporter permease [Planctomycetota bacterium]